MGMHSVRNSDDGSGLPVLTQLSLTVISLTRPCYRRTVREGRYSYHRVSGQMDELSLVQQAMVDVGVVQSGYTIQLRL